MRDRTRMGSSSFRSDNRKSKTCPEFYRRIEKRPRRLKWLGLSVIAVVLVMAGTMAQAQQPKKIRRIGFLTIGSASSATSRFEAFRQGLRELGYVEGQNILIEWRFAEGKREELPALANDLVRLKVDVIVAAGTTATVPAKRATTTIPIVMAYSADPVGTGLVASLSRPGGGM